MLLPGREWQEGYRFAFNGKEQDSEQFGQGNIYDYGFRIYNPRLGKLLSVDPLTPSYPMLTPFQFCSNTPVCAVDIDGLEAQMTIDGSVVYGPVDLRQVNFEKNMANPNLLTPHRIAAVNFQIMNTETFSSQSIYTQNYTSGFSGFQKQSIQQSREGHKELASIIKSNNGITDPSEVPFLEAEFQLKTGIFTETSAKLFGIGLKREAGIYFNMTSLSVNEKSGFEINSVEGPIVEASYGISGVGVGISGDVSGTTANANLGSLSVEKSSAGDSKAVFQILDIGQSANIGFHQSVGFSLTFGANLNKLEPKPPVINDPEWFEDTRQRDSQIYIHPIDHNISINIKKEVYHFN